MSITVDQKEFLRTLKMVSRATADSRTSLPILSCFLLVAKDGKLKISGSNTEVFISGEIAANVASEFSTCVNAKKLIEWLSLRNGEIKVEYSNGNLELSSSKSSVRMPTMPENEFPVAQPFVGDPIICIGSDDLKQALNATCFAAAQDNARPMLQAVYIVTSEGKLTFFATDGFRLSRYIVGDTDKNISVLVPRQSAIDLSRMCDGGMVSIYTNEGKVKFDFGTYYLVAQTIDQKYPDVLALIPQNMKHAASLPSDELATEVRSTMMFGENATAIISLSESAVTLRANGSDGNVSSAIEARYNGDGITFALNSKFLSDVLSVPGGSIATIQVNSERAPSKITFDDLPFFTHVIMPVNMPAANSSNK